MKYTHFGTIKILSYYEEVNELLQVRMIDSGAGIKQSEKDQMFKMFSKGGRNSDAGSISIGLYVCKCIVENSGGTINIYSEGENKGTTI